MDRAKTDYQDKFRFTTIANRQLNILSPLSGSKVDTLLGLLPLERGDAVLDVGSGKGEMLLRLSERLGVRALGIDVNAAHVADAKREARRRRIGRSVEFRCGKFNAADLTNGQFKVVICCGSAHAMGGYAGVLRTARDLVESRGYLILGHTFWKRKPAAEYLKLLGAKLEDEQSHARNASRAKRFGWVDLYSVSSSLDEWDEFEGRYCMAVEQYVMTNPNGPDSSKFLRRIRRWRSGYRRWGRDTLGFGVYLFQKSS